MIKTWNFITIFAGIFLISSAIADNIPTTDSGLTRSLQNTRNLCSGISDRLSEIKKMAGINTVITGAGTLAGGAGVAVGIQKSNLDEKIAEISNMNSDSSNFERVDYDKDIKTQMLNHLENFEKQPSKPDTTDDDKKSKNLGNWRTGLFAANTASNMAGTFISANNRAEQDLREQVSLCIDSVKILSESALRAHVQENRADTDPEMVAAKQISDSCGKYNLSDLDKINSNASGATFSGAIGITTGMAGTITSAAANQGDKKLNTASNVLGVGATGASLVGTAFNASQISAAKKLVLVAQECERTLK